MLLALKSSLSAIFYFPLLPSLYVDFISITNISQSSDKKEGEVQIQGCKYGTYDCVT